MINKKILKNVIVKSIGLMLGNRLNSKSKDSNKKNSMKKEYKWKKDKV